MNKPIMRPIAAEDEIEMAVENAMKDLAATAPEPKDPLPHRDLVVRSRASFSSHLEQLQARIDAVSVDIVMSIKTRDEAVAVANRQHADRMKEHERDLYQIKTLKGAVELAIAALGYDE